MSVDDLVPDVVGLSKDYCLEVYDVVKQYHKIYAQVQSRYRNPSVAEVRKIQRESVIRLQLWCVAYSKRR